MDVIFNLIFILLAALGGGLFAYLLRMPLVVGYILGGMALSFIFGQNSNGLVTVSTIANIGVALLMFTLGLEFTLIRLRGLGEVILVGSLLQIFLTIVFGVIFFPLLGFGFYESLFLGAVASLSSTALVVKILADKNELDTLPGEIAIGWLIIQDLFTLPMIVVLSSVGLSLAGGGGFLWSLLAVGKALSFSILIFAILLFLGKYILPRIFARLSETGVREILLVAAILLCFVLSFAAELLGISFAIGAFLSGLILSSTLANQAIFAEVRPLRDIFAVVFFVSLGFLLKINFLIDNLGLITFLTLLVLIFKFGISSFMVFILGYHSRVAFRVGISLISVGEFAFVIAILAQAQNIISQETYMTLLSVALLSLIISSPLLGHAEYIYGIFSKFVKKRMPFINDWLLSLDRHLLSEEKPIAGHVVVVGHGRVGSYVTNALISLSIPYVVVDYNMRLVKKLSQLKKKIIYGDPADLEVLRATNLDKARALVVAVPGSTVRNMIIANAKTLNKDINIYCRIHKSEEMSQTPGNNISYIQPEFEASLEMTSRLLQNFNIPAGDIRKTIMELEKEHGY
ncbi:cation:proton antiporter [Candidatus Gottesmanbacteria bacterium]|nr:cation:proton antiporter [Candidatus Gottesmanbacteria bacterium]